VFGPSLPRGEGSGPTGPLRISGAASRLGVVVRRPPRYDHARAAADFPSQGDRGRAASTPSNGSLAFTRRRAVRVWGLLLGVPACLPAASLRGGMLAIGRATWPSGHQLRSWSVTRGLECPRRVCAVDARRDAEPSKACWDISSTTGFGVQGKGKCAARGARGSWLRTCSAPGLTSAWRHWVNESTFPSGSTEALWACLAAYIAASADLKRASASDPP
jgi:hypothetical protein